MTMSPVQQAPAAKRYQSLDNRENDLGSGLNRRSLRRLFGYLLPYRVQGLVALVAIALQTLGELALPRLLGLIIDGATVAASRSGNARQDGIRSLFTTVGLFLACVVGVFFARWVQGATTTRLGYRVIFDLRFALFQHMQLIGLRTFDRLGVGRLISRIQSDVSVLQDLLTDGIIGLFADMMVLIGIIIAMLLLDRELALLTFAILPIMIGIVLVWRRYAIPVYRTLRVATSRLTGYSAESISGMRVIQSFRREVENFERFERLNREVYGTNTLAIRLNSVLAPAVELLSGTATVIILVVGGQRAIAGGLTIGALTAFIGYINRFFSPVRTLSERYNSLQSATVAAERIFEVLDEDLEITDKPGVYPLPQINGEVAFEGVTFGYTDRPIINDLNLTIKPGMTVAFVGPTGAGKSSIINLVPRFYDVWEGRVAIDGHDVRDVTLASLRRQFGIVLQDTFLFSMTIGENIRYGRLEATDAEVEDAARAVGIHDFIAALPAGYATKVGERGSGLSVGQRQLIAFARVMLANPRIVVLDEATSSVDTRTEQIVQAALRRTLQGRTALVIAHRLSTIIEADLIVVIDAGRIVEQGRHAELIAQRGAYYRLYTAAQLREKTIIPEGDPVREG
ncbi:MAG: Heterodimeric efflux ABC transporter, permease/ATP-binding subunit 2 [uncultured Thermomicrobiales bacterium]|uniref:Heterodimeric efflux ABC transporter, permease/ATP-binding subunit 2 n=1 Tax=uncultured Thermomicrobiales bacterium TaxID=1645740 RepID=A0A6J4UM60_9BACT|nr:MAG: Heterodimeric efflux ABC transporter, permease/ATP-binding subunit 2 [uncultured Thermomicrobiales bacterium]